MQILRELRPIQAMTASLFFRHRRLLVIGPRQYFGKTELGVRLLHDLTGRPQPSTGMFVAKNSTARKKATREKFLRIFDKKDFSVNTELIFNRKCPTSQIFMGSIDKDPGAQRGGTVHLLHLSEIGFWNIEHGETVCDVWQKVLRNLLSEFDGYCYAESTTNGFNGFKEFWDRAPEFGFHRVAISLTKMLELGLVSQEDYDREKREVHPLVFAQELDCEWVTFQGLVYDEFNENVHIDPNMPGPESWQSVIASIDWGWFPSATCVLFGYVKDGVINIFDELYAHRQRIEDTRAAVDLKLHMWEIEKFVMAADHDAARNAELEARGLATFPADKVNVMGNRIQVKEKLWKRQIKIHPRCVNLLKDVQRATWHPKKEGELDETICTWGHWDGEAALRYLVRALESHESEEPDENPHIGTDQASARAYEMNRRLNGDY